VRVTTGVLTPVAEEHLNPGRIYTSSFSPDRPTLLAVDGDDEDAQLWGAAKETSAIEPSENRDEVT
jgi:hypothetical protein